jgi:hypothetical protein
MSVWVLKVLMVRKGADGAVLRAPEVLKVRIPRTPAASTTSTTTPNTVGTSTLSTNPYLQHH